MSNISAIEIAALTARHFGVNPRWLSDDGQGPAIRWTRTGEARAVAVHLIRKHTACKRERLARLLDLQPDAESVERVRQLEEHIAEQLGSDFLLRVEVGIVETAIHRVSQRRAASAQGRAA